MNKVVKAVALVATAFMILTAEGCPMKDPGNPKTGGKATHIFVWTDGDHNIGPLASTKTIKAIDPPPNCSWTLMYDLPGGKTVVVASGGAKSAKKGVKLGSTRILKYKDPKTHKMVTKKDRPTSFYSENCKTWRD
jgi:hypothetical protein